MPRERTVSGRRSSAVTSSSSLASWSVTAADRRRRFHDDLVNGPAKEASAEEHERHDGESEHDARHEEQQRHPHAERREGASIEGVLDLPQPDVAGPDQRDAENGERRADRDE